MKRAAFILFAFIATATIGYRMAAPNRTGELVVKGAGRASSAGLPTTTNSDPVEVFQRAFWKRPTATDEIIHAERREWKDAESVTRWQWFIQVKPSPELVRHLITENAFNLVPASASPSVESAPDWFQASSKSARALHSTGTEMLIIFDQENNIITATDNGGGFHKSTAAAPKSIAQSQPSPSRLPNSPPPSR